MRLGAGREGEDGVRVEGMEWDGCWDGRKPIVRANTVNVNGVLDTSINTKLIMHSQKKLTIVNLYREKIRQVS